MNESDLIIGWSLGDLTRRRGAAGQRDVDPWIDAFSNQLGKRGRALVQTPSTLEDLLLGCVLWLQPKMVATVRFATDMLRRIEGRERWLVLKLERCSVGGFLALDFVT